MRGRVTKPSSDTPDKEFIARQWNPAGPEGTVFCVDQVTGATWTEKFEDLKLVEGEGTEEEFRAFLDVHEP